MPPALVAAIVWFSYPLEYYEFRILAERLDTIHTGTTFLEFKGAIRASVYTPVGASNNIKPSPYTDYLSYCIIFQLYPLHSSPR